MFLSISQGQSRKGALIARRQTKLGRSISLLGRIHRGEMHRREQRKNPRVRRAARSFVVALRSLGCLAEGVVPSLPVWARGGRRDLHKDVVIARNSSFAYKGARAADVVELGII
jgi:hypothetical protein